MTGSGTHASGTREAGEDGRPSEGGTATGDAGGPSSAASSDADGRQVTVLHVDDEPEVGQLVATFLERADGDLRVLTATSAREGLQRLERGDVDCVVSDYEMPGVDGLEFCRAVRRREPDLPFVLFTWRSRGAVVGEPGADALDAHLQKDYDLDSCESLAELVRDLVDAPAAEVPAASDD